MKPIKKTKEEIRKYKMAIVRCGVAQEAHQIL